MLDALSQSKYIQEILVDTDSPVIAEKAKEIGIENVAFDRSGYQYHGRIRALADAAREGGLQF